MMTTIRKISLFILYFFAFFLYSEDAKSWGRKGHETVARLAEEQLTPSAQRFIRQILTIEQKNSLSEIALWADFIRNNPFIRQQAHTLRLPLTEAPYDSSIHCVDSKCPIATINLAISILRSNLHTPESKMIALKQLVHIVGDIHQPLHASEDPGFWYVLYRGRRVRLHFVWDDSIIEAQQYSIDDLVRQMLSEKSARATELKSPTDWAIESRDIARDIILPRFYKLDSVIREHSNRGKYNSEIKLDEDYMEIHWPIVKLRLSQAGDRLAKIIENVAR
jgi:hypothetical protein